MWLHINLRKQIFGFEFKEKRLTSFVTSTALRFASIHYASLFKDYFKFRTFFKQFAKPSTTKEGASLFLGQGRIPMLLATYFCIDSRDGLCSSTYFCIPVVGARLRIIFPGHFLLPVRRLYITGVHVWPNFGGRNFLVVCWSHCC